MLSEPPRDERQFKVWLQENAGEVLARFGVRPGARVTDWGCGSGVFSIAAAQIVGEKGSVLAVDVRPEALDEVCRKGANAGLQNVETRLVERGPAAAADLPGGADVILLYDVLQETGDSAPGLLGILARKLALEGVLSVFPMHVGAMRLMEMLSEVGILELRDRIGLVLNSSRR
jgi:tRNA A58 N-methylase Trm61